MQPGLQKYDESQISVRLEFPFAWNLITSMEGGRLLPAAFLIC
jgi:hypothetical protein